MDIEYDFTRKTYSKSKIPSTKLHKANFYIFNDGFTAYLNNTKSYSKHIYHPCDCLQHEYDNEVRHIHLNEKGSSKHQAMFEPCNTEVVKKEPVAKIILKEEENVSTRPPIKNVISKIEQETIENGFKKQGQATRMDWNEYHRLSVIHAFLDELESDYPSICTVGTIGNSLEGRNLKILKVSNSDTRNQGVWMDAGIHAREWIAPAVATYIANHIVRNFTSLPTCITNKDWYFHSVVNPDGYEYSHTDDRMWRKNRAWLGGTCVGVDLNRNFSYGWGGKGSSASPVNAFYRGPKAFSEPESCAIRDILLNSGIPFKVYITLHSYGQVILFPFAYRDELCSDYVRLLEGATIMSKAIHESSGNIYKVGISRDVMYGAAGTSNDWSYGEARIPYCYLIELRSKKHKFMLPKDEIEETGNEILNCVKALMEFLDENREGEKVGPEEKIITWTATLIVLEGMAQQNGRGVIEDLSSDQ